MISSAIRLICERGVSATGLADLLSRSRSSRNSLYQHFPAGKSQLVEIAVREAGAAMDVDLCAAMDGATPTQGVGLIVDDWKRRLTTSDYTRGCPVMGAALAESEPAVQSAAADVFGLWRNTFATAFVAGGLPLDRAGALAGFVVSAIEGAIVQCRATKTTTPLDDARAELILLFDNHFQEQR
ncbi:putative transcriptional regulator, TetR family protein [Rhodococcoides trifolii]|uniref:Transcriptional regulator, TetR family protein n=2 Tax=Rhodococcoides trifolii TaxID=908250 RepID=A0A917G628_9NOCA|nr:putative transcriptional regulator, TetR family protein [Rhodococcus trifolii]